MSLTQNIKFILMNYNPLGIESKTKKESEEVKNLVYGESAKKISEFVNDFDTQSELQKKIYNLFLYGLPAKAGFDVQTGSAINHNTKSNKDLVGKLSNYKLIAEDIYDLIE
jgi:hypothetical protein